jgi:hypothetical protein
VTRTRPSLLVAVALLGAALGWLLETALVASGRAAFIPPVTLAAALALIAVIVVVMAVPVFRVVRGTAKSRIDPFYATRVVLLAKATSITGALLGGAAVAVLVYLLTRSVTPPTASLGLAIATVVAGVLLLVGGLVAEKMCTLPPSDDDDTTTLPASQDHV